MAVAIFEHINHRTMFLFTFPMMNLIVDSLSFFFCLFLWYYLKFIFRFIILLNVEVSARYFETCSFSDLLMMIRDGQE